MQTQPIVDELRQLKLDGMAEALQQQAEIPNSGSMSFEDRLQALVAAERVNQNDKRYRRLLRAAKLKLAAQPEDIDFRPGRGLDKAQIVSLLHLDWVQRAQSLLITGSTGTGKTWLACCFGVQAARRGLRVVYRRVNRMLEDMEYGHDDGSIARQRNHLAKADLLILDDFGLTALNPIGRSDLLEVLDDRSSNGATIIAGQMPVKHWHEFIGDAAIADAVMDRIAHNGHRIALTGDSMRGAKN